MDAEELKAELRATRERLLATISGVTEEQFKSLRDGNLLPPDFARPAWMLKS